MGWLSRAFGKKQRGEVEELPAYTLLTAGRTCNLPGELAEREHSQIFAETRESIEAELLQSERRPSEDAPLFCALPAHGGPLTLQLTDSAQACLLVFSSPVRAADYKRVLFAMSPAGREIGELRFWRFSPSDFVEILSEFRQSPGIEQFALDRCPRCDVFTANDSDVQSAENAIQIWAIFKATEHARAELYGHYATSAARRGDLELARDVALEIVGHVTPDDSRAHLLLGKVAAALDDEALRQEATAWLRFLGKEAALQELASFEYSARTTF